jgi:hypothetical protein
MAENTVDGPNEDAENKGYEWQIWSHICPSQEDTR